MKFSAATLALLLSSSSAFTPKQTPSAKVTTAKQSSVTAPDSTSEKKLFDPLGLYPKNSPERKEGRLEPLESVAEPEATVKDPLGIYSAAGESSAVDSRPMSASVPFLERPPLLDGTLPGDRGFDPFNFAKDKDALQWYRNAEVKHARLAMLAAVGWPLSELFDKKLAGIFDLQPLVDVHDRVPSVLNGGLGNTPGAYWAAALGVAFAIESLGFLKEQSSAAVPDATATPGDLGFDPLGLAGNTKEERLYKAEAELFNGRLAMLAITGFALQEFWTQTAVINQTPFFFKPFNVVMEHFQDMAGNGGL